MSPITAIGKHQRLGPNEGGFRVGFAPAAVGDRHEHNQLQSVPLRLTPIRVTVPPWAGGSTHGSGGWLARRASLKARGRRGCSLCARQMRRTEPSEMSMALAIARLIQWVARRGGAVHVNATTRVVVCAATAERRE
jgi:hypothetical protein